MRTPQTPGYDVWHQQTEGRDLPAVFSPWDSSILEITEDLALQCCSSCPSALLHGASTTVGADTCAELHQ